jgi:hypothetical protein
MQLPLLDMEVVLQLHPRALLYLLDPLEREETPEVVVPLLEEIKLAVAVVLGAVKDLVAPEVVAKEAVVPEEKEWAVREAQVAQAAKGAALEEGVVQEERDALEN